MADSPKKAPAKKAPVKKAPAKKAPAKKATASTTLPSSIPGDRAPLNAWAGTVVITPTGTIHVSTRRSQPG